MAGSAKVDERQVRSVFVRDIIVVLQLKKQPKKIYSIHSMGKRKEVSSTKSSGDDMPVRVRGLGPSDVLPALIFSEKMCAAHALDVFRF